MISSHDGQVTDAIVFGVIKTKNLEPTQRSKKTCTHGDAERVQAGWSETKARDPADL